MEGCKDRSDKAKDAFIRIGRAGCKKRTRYFEGKRIGEKGIIIPKDKFKEFVEFQKERIDVDDK